MSDIIILAVILVFCILAARSVIKRKGKCSCGCSECSGCDIEHRSSAKSTKPHN